jgi:ribonuclease HI
MYAPPAMTDLPQVTLITDGACSGNPGPGGYAALLRFGEHEKIIQGGASLTTNNRMELRAAIAGLSALKRPCQVDIYTDSDYLKSGITKWIAAWQRNGWRTQDKQPVKNQDLWRALQAALRPHEVSWHWVRGHAGNALNERADRLAVQALQQYGIKGQPDMDQPGAVVPE